MVISASEVARRVCGLWRKLWPAAKAIKIAIRTTTLAGKKFLRYKFIADESRQMPMQINDKAPEFTLANENGEKVSLKDYRGKNLVLFFFPKADTPG